MVQLNARGFCFSDKSILNDLSMRFHFTAELNGISSAKRGDVRNLYA